MSTTVYSYRKNITPQGLSDLSTFPTILPAEWELENGEIVSNLSELTKDELENIGWYGPIEMPEQSYFDIDTFKWIEKDYNPYTQISSWRDDLGSNYGFVITEMPIPGIDFQNFAISLREDERYQQIILDSYDNFSLQSRFMTFELDLNRVLSNQINWGKHVVSSFRELINCSLLTEDQKDFLKRKSVQYGLGYYINENINVSIYMGASFEIDSKISPTLNVSIDGTYKFIQDITTLEEHSIAFYTDSECTHRYEKNVYVEENPVTKEKITYLQIYAGGPETLYYKSVDRSINGGIINLKYFI